MHKHWLMVLLGVLGGWGQPRAQAQAATQEALAHICDCLKAATEPVPATDRLTPLLDSCLSEGLYVNLTGVLREQGMQLEEDSSLYLLAQYLHTELSRSCPSFRIVTHSLAALQLEEVKAANQQSHGLLLELQTKQQFPILILLNEQGESEQFLWLHEFDGSTRFMEGLQDYRHSRMTIVWKPVELYDSHTRQYQWHKEILLIEQQGHFSPKERRAWLKRHRQAVKAGQK